MTVNAHPKVEVDWLGTVPMHWEVMRLRRVLHVRSGDFISTDDFLADGMPVFGGNGHRGYTSGWNTDADTLLIGRYGALCGNVHHVQQRVWATEHAFRVFKKKVFSTRFMFYVLGAIDLNQFSARAAQPGLNSTIVEEQFFACPPLVEQRAIAAFLDREAAKIDALIQKQGEFVKLLDEHQHATVTEAVMRGLNPAIPQRETGIKELPSVPQNWRVVRFRAVLDRVEQGWSPQCENHAAEIGEWGVLKVGCVNGAEFDASENKALPPDLPPRPELEVRPGDLLMSRANTRELVGSAALVPDIQPKLLLSDKLYRLHLDRRAVDPRFGLLSLSSGACRPALEAAATGTSPSMKNISQDAVRNLWLPLPPLEEQAEIASLLEDRQNRIEDVRARSIEMTERLREHRAALITAAVTGRIDLRAGAPAPPEVAAA